MGRKPLRRWHSVDPPEDPHILLRHELDWRTRLTHPTLSLNAPARTIISVSTCLRELELMLVIRASSKDPNAYQRRDDIRVVCSPKVSAYCSSYTATPF